MLAVSFKPYKKTPILPIFTLDVRHMEIIKRAQIYTVAPLRRAQESCKR